MKSSSCIPGIFLFSFLAHLHVSILPLSFGSSEIGVSGSLYSLHVSAARSSSSLFTFSSKTASEGNGGDVKAVGRTETT